MSNDNARAEIEQGLLGFLQLAVQLVQGDRGLIVTPLPAGQDYEAAAAVGFPEELSSIWMSGQISQTIIRRVGSSKQPLLSKNAIAEQQYEDINSVIVSGLRSVMCVPIEVDGELWGVMYVDNNLEIGAFKAEQLNALHKFTDQLSEVIKVARTT